MEIIVKNLSELNAAAEKFIQALEKKRIVCFDAPMGSGKTTFIKALLHYLACKDEGASPTYSIVNVYSSEKKETIFHLDLYRLNSLEEAFDIGIEDILYDGNYCFIEWPEKIRNLLPENYVWVTISVNNVQERIIRFEL